MRYLYILYVLYYICLFILLFIVFKENNFYHNISRYLYTHNRQLLKGFEGFEAFWIFFQKVKKNYEQWIFQKIININKNKKKKALVRENDMKILFIYLEKKSEMVLRKVFLIIVIQFMYIYFIFSSMLYISTMVRFFCCLISTARATPSNPDFYKCV